MLDYRRYLALPWPSHRACSASSTHQVVLATAAATWLQLQLRWADAAAFSHASTPLISISSLPPPLTLASDSLLRLQLRSCSTAVPRSCSRRCFLRLVCPFCLLRALQCSAGSDTRQQHSVRYHHQRFRSQQLRRPTPCLLTWLKLPSTSSRNSIYSSITTCSRHQTQTRGPVPCVVGISYAELFFLIAGQASAQHYPHTQSTAFNCHHQIQ